MTGEWCCGDGDCHVVDYVREREDSDFEFIEAERAIPLSPDGRIHRCVEHGYVDDGIYSRCFIIPPLIM